MKEFKPRFKGIGWHVLAGALALLFVMSGGMKFTGAEEMVAKFAEWGYPGWFLYVVGVVEVGGALMLLFPKLRFFGGALLSVTMVGAAATHVAAGEYAQSIPAAVLFVLTGLIAWKYSLRDEPERRHTTSTIHPAVQF